MKYDENNIHFQYVYFSWDRGQMRISCAESFLKRED